ncbi:hypothetical protein PUN28_018203 [Cardiocondyla obscurior]|uniref:Ribosomal protein L2 n=1 Tax=Cardiocondyla obscurior TaxID=286306 RepID=A0AAW2EGA0_9HYME
MTARHWHAHCRNSYTVGCIMAGARSQRRKKTLKKVSKYFNVRESCVKYIPRLKSRCCSSANFEERRIRLTGSISTYRSRNASWCIELGTNFNFPVKTICSYPNLPTREASPAFHENPRSISCYLFSPWHFVSRPKNKRLKHCVKRLPGRITLISDVIHPRTGPRNRF